MLYNYFTMEKRSILETAAILVAIFMAAWAIRGEIAANTAAIARLEGVLITHINGHNHSSAVALGDSEVESQ